MTREAESYDVSIRAVNYDGTPSDSYFYRFVPIAQPGIYKSQASGPVTVRLPAVSTPGPVSSGT